MKNSSTSSSSDATCFIVRAILFGVVGVVLLCLLFPLAGTWVPTIPSGTNVLITGDSLPECAIDDTMLSGVYNWAQSGASYFYSYIKVRWAIEHIAELNTVVLGYSYGDIAPKRDAWFSEARYIARLRDYFPLLNRRDFYELFRANPQEVLEICFYVIQDTVARIATSQIRHYAGSTLGGYRHLERDEVEGVVARDREVLPVSVAGYSSYQEIYLVKIYELCERTGVRLVLLNVPIHPITEKGLDGYKDHYYELAAEWMPNATLINHSDMYIPDFGYGDLEHLNYKGAEIYTTYLREISIENGFRPNPAASTD